jgi:hypothetical protein
MITIEDGWATCDICTMSWSVGYDADGNWLTEDTCWNCETKERNRLIPAHIVAALFWTRWSSEHCVYCNRDTYGEHKYLCIACRMMKQSGTHIPYRVPEWVQLRLPSLDRQLCIRRD